MIAAWLLGGAWGLLLAGPMVLSARRRQVATRAAWLRCEPPVGAARPSPSLARLAARLPLAAAGRVVRGVRERQRVRRAEALIGAELPVALDLLGVAVGAGCTPYLAAEVAARWAPPAIGARLAAVPRSCGLGMSVIEALDEMAAATPCLQPLADALTASDRLGAPIGPALARLAAEERAALRRRAEADARRMPVRLLFPLVFLVLPAFGLLTVVPTLVSGLGRA